MASAGDEGPIQLKLCECERANGAPNGLSCDKEGWFISSFEREGSWVRRLNKVLCMSSSVTPSTCTWVKSRPTSNPHSGAVFIAISLLYLSSSLQLQGGGLVPLSHAICCRPCLPTELPPDPSGSISPGDKPLAVVSVGCHASTNQLRLK